MTGMSPLQGSQADIILWSKYYYVALTSLWVYDCILCVPDSVAFLVDSRCGLGTMFYLACSHLPSAFMLLNMLLTFLPRGSYTLCRFIYITNICVGFLSMFSAECIFLLRTIAIWYRERKFMVFKIINTIAYLIPIIVCFQEFILSMGECSIPGGIGYVDSKARSQVIIVYCLLVAGESEILVCVLYRTFESHGSWKIENRLMRGLMHHNLLYFSCSFGFSLAVILATVFLPFPVVHMIAETQVIVLSLLVTRMHRDFWRSDRVSCGNDGVDLSLTTFMAATPDIVPEDTTGSRPCADG
ncbi:hypothetical protein CY34DRAFT_417660 [Suillus luteus UH-Slu-Lm8-n1]|uniref:Unplaced genomic scaffold CY34scaffold_289, whole genome shotgun sequence n=1 Tax=Suillus luteus UH-Slu-Lm8-n1 TaxID=930992 RepID=A0A0C9ZKG3_9AGAM|nr:hypothetical protein CY34DRAFT_417660 [Suillus luteus UH-Slu-Lm8-n1]